jgi:hypothetical protein
MVARVSEDRDAVEFEAWLGDHVDQTVDLGLCYGWISGQRKAYDQLYYCRNTSHVDRGADGRR